MKSKEHKLNVDLMHEECAEIGLKYFFGIPNVIKNEYIRLAQYAPQDKIKAVLYNSLHNSKSGVGVTIQKIHEENDLWIRRRQKHQAKEEKKRAIKIMKAKKHKVEIPEGYEVAKTVEHRYRDEDDNEIISNIKILLKAIKKELPKTWEELNIDIHYGYIARLDGSIAKHNNIDQPDVPTWPTKELAKADLALRKVVRLRDVYNDGYKYPFINPFSIYRCNDEIMMSEGGRGPLVLHRDIAKEFFMRFAELLDTAKPLL